ncbi:MAG: hypothetical protein L3J39_10650, partial [Verrucomicrobiales bacterium]|nr:hypothetical protein [Verrucomicrobiales bacterium]
FFPLLPTPPRGDAVTSSSRQHNGCQRPRYLTSEEDAALQRTSVGVLNLSQGSSLELPFFWSAVSRRRYFFHPNHTNKFSVTITWRFELTKLYIYSNFLIEKVI